MYYHVQHIVLDRFSAQKYYLKLSCPYFPFGHHFCLEMDLPSHALPLGNGHNNEWVRETYEREGTSDGHVQPWNVCSSCYSHRNFPQRRYKLSSP